MHRSILTALAAGVILLAFAALPPMLPASTTLNLSSSALARSNIHRPQAGAQNGNAKTRVVTKKGMKGNEKGFCYGCGYMGNSSQTGAAGTSLSVRQRKGKTLTGKAKIIDGRSQ